ncbi:MAG TPA: hypothetical protein VMF30_00225 [Pirellulales bacterium]|nr:hypothetical protein [Pirellulales bacterium]
MRKILMALLLVSGIAAAAHAADLSSDVPPPTRFARLQNLMAPPAESTYSLGGYAPADPNTNYAPNPGLVDKTQLESPPGCCGGDLWYGYQARPCHHRHHYGMGGDCGRCGGGCGSNWGQGCGHGWGWGHWGGGGCGQTACCGGCGGMGMGGYGLGGPAFVAPGCGCGNTCCAPRHCCHLFGCLKRSRCGCEVATTCDSCGCGAGGDAPMTQPTPADDNAPRPENIEPQAPAPAPAPAPSAQRPPRLLRPMAALSSKFTN